MILEGIFKLITGIINLIPFNLPSLPEQFMTALDFIFDGIIGSLGFIALFIDLKFWIICAVAVTIVVNIKKVWNTIVFCLNLIPGVNIISWK